MIAAQARGARGCGVSQSRLPTHRTPAAVLRTGLAGEPVTRWNYRLCSSWPLFSVRFRFWIGAASRI